MPELPEVETIRRQFEEEIVGRRIDSVDVNLPKMIRGSLSDFTTTLAGVRFSGARRRSKILILDVDNAHSLLVHLKMSGQLYRIPAEAEIIKHTHVVLHLDDGTDLRHRDVRQFGYLKLVRTEEVEKAKEIIGLGPDPLTEGFSLDLFKAILKARSRSKIKSVLLDQSRIGGIGNIYTDESLFDARIHPERQARTLSSQEVNDLYRAVRRLLNASIERRGTSVDLYVDLHGQKGENQNYLQVYGKQGEFCPRCGHEIERIKVTGRGTYFCPICQKSP